MTEGLTLSCFTFLSSSDVHRLCFAPTSSYTTASMTSDEWYSTVSIRRCLCLDEPPTVQREFRCRSEPEDKCWQERRRVNKCRQTCLTVWRLFSTARIWKTKARRYTITQLRPETFTRTQTQLLHYCPYGKNSDQNRFDICKKWSSMKHMFEIEHIISFNLYELKYSSNCITGARTYIHNLKLANI